MRSKHDMATQRCIYRYDQYNPWLGYPIGAKNQFYYLTFLFFLSINYFLVDWYLFSGMFESSFGCLRIPVWSWSLATGIFEFCYISLIWVPFTLLALRVSTVIFPDDFRRCLWNVTQYEIDNRLKHAEYMTLMPYRNTFDLGWKCTL